MEEPSIQSIVKKNPINNPFSKSPDELLQKVSKKMITLKGKNGKRVIKSGYRRGSFRHIDSINDRLEIDLESRISKRSMHTDRISENSRGSLFLKKGDI